MMPIRHPAWCSALCVPAAAALASLPRIAVPPTQTNIAAAPCLPDAPAKLAISGQVCTDSKYVVALNWSDKAENEQGYRINRDGASIATRGKNAKGFTDEPPGSGPYTYGVEAWTRPRPHGA